MLDLVLSSAKLAVAPDLLGSFLGFLFCVAITAFSTGDHKLKGEDLKLYHDIAKTNVKRVKIRLVAKLIIFSLVLYLEWTN
jgi:hypothetical protein